MSELPAIIKAVEAGLKAADAACGSYSDDPSGYHQRRREAMRGLATQLSKKFGASVNDRWDGARVRIGGTSASSTSGLAGALSNWLVSARKREAAA